MDTCAQFYRRVKEGRHPFSPDRGHFHHHLIEAGIPVGFAVPIIFLIITTLGLLGIFAPALGTPLPIITGLWIITILAHMAISRHPHRYVACFSNLAKHITKP